MKNGTDGSLWGSGRRISGWVGRWVSQTRRALCLAGSSFGDCVAAPAGLNGGMRSWPQQPEASGPV